MLLLQDAEVYVSEWDMYDTLEAMKQTEQSKEQDQGERSEI